MKKARRWMANPWFFFLLFTLVNALLSYFPLAPAVRAGAFILVLSAMMVLLLLDDGPISKEVKPLWGLESLPPISPWIWLCVIGLGLFLRFYKLESLSAWPNLDEGRVSLFALEQAAHWDGKLLFGYNQLPPLFYWLYALFFRVFSPSLFSLWLFPAVLSALILGLTLGTSRLFFSKSFSFLLTAFMALGFWPLYAGRFAAQGLLVLFWELLALWVLGLFLTASSPLRACGYAGILGVLVGSGFYVHLHWPVVALMVTLAFGGIAYGPKRGFATPRRFLLAYFIPCLLIPIPLGLAILRTPSFGDYSCSLLAFPTAGQDPFNGFSSFISSLSALFWGVHLDYFAYKPFWGGFLNPVMGALFFLGLAYLWKNRRQGLPLWILGALALFLVPCFLTNNVETFRMIQILPPLLATAALGLQVLIKNSAEKRKILFLVFLFPATWGLDIFHLNVAYASFWTSHPDQWSKNYKTHAFYEAFQSLGPLREGKTPGALLFSTLVAPDDQTLAAATYPFNALWNSAIGPGEIRWAAFFQWEDEDAYLSKRFPSSRAFDLDMWPENLFQGLQWIHGLRLRLVPVDVSNRTLFARWLEADRCLEEAAFLDLNRPGRESPSGILQTLSSRRRLFQGDPYLESLFWERMAGYEVEGQEGPAAVESMRKAVRLGCPRASAFQRLGILEMKNQDAAGARSAFIQAGLLNPLFKPPAVLLERLGVKGRWR
jgi:hypothetical protein